MFIIKICGITNEEDALFASEAGVNALGFNFYPKSPRYITPDRAREIANTLDKTILRVGVFVNATVEEISSIADRVPLDVLQLHGTSPSDRHHRIWRAINPNQPPADPFAEAYLMDTPFHAFGGSGQSFNWRLAAQSAHRIIVAGGLDGSNVAEAIRIAQPWGVDACSRLESTPGKKDPRRIQEFAQAALSTARLLPRLAEEISL